MQSKGVSGFSIKWVVLPAILSITVAFAGSIGWGILQSWSAYRAAQEQRQFDLGANQFIKGLYEVLLERLASNNALQAPEAASASTLSAIDAHRKIVGENFDIGLVSLERWEFPDKASLLSTLKGSLQKADDYRRRSDEAIRLPRERRDSELLKTFVPAMTEMVNVSLKLGSPRCTTLRRTTPGLRVWQRSRRSAGGCGSFPAWKGRLWRRRLRRERLSSPISCRS
jgi:hypothetical protein